MTDFLWNPELDESLFSLDPPPEYWQGPRMAIKAGDPSLDDVAVLLRAWSSGNGGVFPDKLNPAQWGVAAEKADWSFVRDKEHEKEVRTQIGRAFMYLFGNARWTYAGADVKLGDADTLVLWAHPAKGAGKTKAIFGDASVHEIPVEELPATR